MLSIVLLGGLVFGTGATAADGSLADMIQGGDRDAGLKVLDVHTDVNAPQPDGTTPLHWAVYRDDLGLVKALLVRGARVNVSNSFGSTPLAEAVKVADLAIVDELIRKGADVEAANTDGQTVLMLAARNGTTDIARVLLRHGANVNARESWRGQTALMWAAAQSHPGMVELLTKHHAQLDVAADENDWGTQVTSEPRAQYRPSGGMTALIYAARSGCVPCGEALLKAGADINLPNPDGVTPLMTALDNLHFDFAKLLLDRGANPHVWDWWGRTALYIAVDMHSYPNSRAAFQGPKVQIELTDRTTAADIIKGLLAAGVNPNPQLDMHRPGRGGNTARFVENLLTTGATPLLRAAVAQDPEAAQLLLQHGALVNLPNVMGVTPLMAAAGMGVSTNDPRPLLDGDVQARAVATLEVLVNAGADVKARVSDTSSHNGRIARPSTMTDRQGQTALYAPVNWGWPRVTKFLLDHGASADVTDENGKGPLDPILHGDVAGRDHAADAEVVALVRGSGS